MISDVKTTQIAHKIAQLKQELAELGPMHPGSLSEQYNVCGKPGCRCKDPKNPQKHGPYYQLSFTWRGKSWNGSSGNGSRTSRAWKSILKTYRRK